MSAKNRFGLKRNIPADVKRAVRQRCGFGCVVCGSSIYQYEHFDPEFKNASEHQADGVTLLCGACHEKKTRKLWSKEKIAENNRNPYALKQGFSSDFFDVDVVQPTIIIGGTKFLGQGDLIIVKGTSIISIRPPVQANSPFLISGIFCNDLGNPMFSIVENEFRNGIHNWDVEFIGPKMTIRREQGKIALVLKKEGRSSFIIERIDMRYQGWTITGIEGGPFVCQGGSNSITIGGGGSIDGKIILL